MMELEIDLGMDDLQYLAKCKYFYLFIIVLHC